MHLIRPAAAHTARGSAEQVAGAHIETRPACQRVWVSPALKRRLARGVGIRAALHRGWSWQRRLQQLARILLRHPVAGLAAAPGPQR